MHRRKWTVTVKTRQFVKYLLHVNSIHKKASAIKGLKGGGLIYRRGLDVINLLHVRFCQLGDKSDIKLMMQKSRCSQRLDKF